VQRAAEWMTVPRLDSNYFIEPSGLGPGPYTLRITGSDGQQLVEPSVMLRAAENVMGTQRSSECRMHAVAKRLFPTGTSEP
jgi:expansin (peptidoglycan-binding protein)